MTESIIRFDRLIEEHVHSDIAKQNIYLAAIDMMLDVAEGYLNKKPNSQEESSSSDQQ